MALTAIENIALGKPYTWSRTPNYSLCGKDQTRKQLTDGIRVSLGDLQAGKLFWILPQTVGWSTNPPIITIDLGEDMPISGVSCSTAAGHGGVELPRNLFVLVSTDQKRFHLVADLAEDIRPESIDGRHKTYELRTDRLKTHGRYVRFIPCIGNSRFVFIDELEVYRGTPTFLEEPYSAETYADHEIPLTEMIKTGIRGRLKNDISELKQILNNSTAAAGIKNEISAELKNIEQKIVHLNIPAEFQAIVPVHPLEEKILSLHARILRSEGFPKLEVWRSYRYDELALFQRPGTAVDAINLKLLPGEHRSEVVNFTNAGENALPITLTLENLAGTVIRQVEYVDTASNRLDASALPEIIPENGIYKMIVPSGMTRQLWLTFHGEDPSILNGAIHINAGPSARTLPVKIEIAGPRLPQNTGLRTGLWDYAVSKRHGIGTGNQRLVIADLRRNGINIAFATREVAALPSPGDIGADGTWRGKPDFSAFDEWLKRWPDAEHYQIFLGVTPDSTFGGLKPGTAVFNAAVKEWSEAWNVYAKRHALKPGRIQFHFFDEPRSVKDYEVLLRWLAPFCETNEMISVFNNPVKLDKEENFNAAKAPLAYCDIICPMTREFVNYQAPVLDFLTGLKKQGKKLYLYSCDGPSWFYHPVYFRLQPWYAFKYGAKGSLMWVYSDIGNNWNDYISRYSESYSMVYLSPASTTSSKRWEAFKEGMEDYAYLALLDEQLKKFPSSQPERLKIQAAVEKIHKAGYFEKGKANFTGDSAGICRKADELREYMLDIFLNLPQN
jgi:hypothetical protein